MKLFIDTIPQDTVCLTATSEYGDIRRYYECGKTLIVCRDNLDLPSLLRKRVDANVGWDTAMPGFTRFEETEGEMRTKITIYRIVSGYAKAALSDILRGAL